MIYGKTEDETSYLNPMLRFEHKMIEERDYNAINLNTNTSPNFKNFKPF